MEYEEEALTCHTAPGVAFTTMDELKAHYRSDWHRYNLKRKVAGLPVVGEALFQRVMQQAAGAAGEAKRVGKSHLKRPELEPRSVAKAKRLETWIEHHRDEIEAARAAMEARESSRRAEEDETEDDEAYDDFDEGDDDEVSESEDGWESMDEDEAREVLARMDRMAASGPRGDSDSDDDGGESDDASDGDGMELDLTNAPVRLAENGYELIITRDDGTKRRIGPRELRRYYKQRHRPEDDRAAVLANRASTTERGLARLGETRAGERGVQKFDTAGKFVGLQISIMVKRAQKAARKYERNNMFQGNSSIKKFDLNGQNVKIKLPKACPY